MRMCSGLSVLSVLKIKLLLSFKNKLVEYKIITVGTNICL